MSGANRRVPTIRQFAILFARDLRQEMHTFDMLSSMGVYALLVLVIFGVSIMRGRSGFDTLSISSGLTWAMIVFTSLLGLSRSFVGENADGGLEGVLITPIDRSVIFLAKAASNTVFLLIVESLACPLFYFFFLNSTLPPAQLWLVPLPLLAGSIGIAGVGTILATITSNAHGKDILLAILFVPVVFPLLYAVVSATSAVLTGPDDLAVVFLPSMAVAVGYDVIMVSLSWLLYDFVVSA